MDRRASKYVSGVITMFSWLATAAIGAVLGQQQDGFVTFYGSLSPAPAPGPGVQGGGLLSGACGYGQLQAEDWPYDRVVSLGPNNTIATGIGANKLGCGQCVRATCTGSNCAANASSGVILWVTDSCPGCAANQLNVPAATFLQDFGSALSLGQVNASFQQVDCSPPGVIEAKVVQSRAEGGGFIAVALLSVAGSGMLAGVDIKTSGSQTWAPMANSYGAVWQASNFGAPPLDLRITTFQGDATIAPGVITSISNQVFPTTVQFRPSAPLAAPAVGTNLSGSTGLQLPFSPMPAQTYQYAAAPALSTGQRINSPLYFAPADVSLLAIYPNLFFSYIECFDGTPILNLTIDRLKVPSADGSTTQAFALHTLDYASFHSRGSTPFYKLVDYSFLNLETGEFAQLYATEYITFSNTSYDGTIPADDYDAEDTVYPQYVQPASLTGPAGFEYTILLPPGPNEDPTPAYLRALETMFYYLSTLTLGNSGSRSDYVTCSQAYAQIGPWADYVRSIIAQLAPANQIMNGLYNNIPLGSNYAFQDTSFVIMNGLIQGNVLNTTTQLSSRDCGALCRPASPQPRSATFCSAWSWCGSISGCGNGTPYQTCQLRNSTTEYNTTAPNGFLNLQQNGSIRFTSGVLSLPPPTGMSLFVFAPNNSGIGYGLMTDVTFGPAIAP